MKSVGNPNGIVQSFHLLEVFFLVYAWIVRFLFLPSLDKQYLCSAKNESNPRIDSHRAHLHTMKIPIYCNFPSNKNAWSSLDLGHHPARSGQCRERDINTASSLRDKMLCFLNLRRCRKVWQSINTPS